MGSFAKQSQNYQPESLGKRIRKYLVSILFFPAVVTKRYKSYHVGLYTMIDVFGFKYAANIVKLNIKRINLFIRLPLAIGILFSTFLIITKFDAISSEVKGLKKIYRVEINKATLPHPSMWVRRTNYRLDNHAWVLLPILGGYIFCLVGSALLSLNPSFNEEKKISRVLAIHRYVDDEGEPWQVSWTPYGIIFFGYNCDPNTVKANVKFWNTLNFQPDDPKIHESDSSIFMFKRSYELPSKIPLNLLPLIKVKLANKVKLPDKAPDKSAEAEELLDEEMMAQLPNGEAPVSEHEDLASNELEDQGEPLPEDLTNDTLEAPGADRRFTQPKGIKDILMSAFEDIRKLGPIELRFKKQRKISANPLSLIKGGDRKLIYKRKNKPQPEPISEPAITNFDLPNTTNKSS